MDINKIKETDEKDLEKLVEINILKLLNSINEKRELWLLKCMTILHPNITFKKEKLREDLTKVVLENNYKLINEENTFGFSTYYLAYEGDIQSEYIKYIAKFNVGKEDVDDSGLFLPFSNKNMEDKLVDYNFQIYYTLPTIDAKSNKVLKTLVYFKEDNTDSLTRGYNNERPN